MPRYFFNVYDDPNGRDVDGCELPDLNAVRVEAIRTAGQVIQDSAFSWSGKEWVMIASDQTGMPVMTMRFSVVMPAWGAPALATLGAFAPLSGRQAD